jgi:hypothetical protein
MKIEKLVNVEVFQDGSFSESQNRGDCIYISKGYAITENGKILKTSQSHQLEIYRRRWQAVERRTTIRLQNDTQGKS